MKIKDVIPMEDYSPAKYSCYFCKSTRNVGFWAFIKPAVTLMQTVPCCLNCANKFKEEKKNDLHRKNG